MKNWERRNAKAPPRSSFFILPSSFCIRRGGVLGDVAGLLELHGGDAVVLDGPGIPGPTLDAGELVEDVVAIKAIELL
jgi:hypothetical protein